MADRPLNATAASLLGLLHHGTQTGWDLVATAQTVIGDFWSLTRSQVYRELAAMTEAGFVEAGERGSRDRKPYTITDTGRAAFAEWIDHEPATETIRFPLLLTVVFGGHLPPTRLAAFLTRQRQLHAERLDRYDTQYEVAMASPGGPDPFALAALDFGRCYERAVLDWFTRLPAEWTTTAPS